MSAYINSRHQKFIDEYVKLGNAKEAAILAGYSEKTAASQGSRLLRDPRIEKFLKRAQRNFYKTHDLSPETVILEINRIAKSESTKAVDKLRALEMLCKHFGLFITPQDIIDRLDEKGMDELLDKIMNRKRELENVY